MLIDYTRSILDAPVHTIVHPLLVYTLEHEKHSDLYNLKPEENYPCTLSTAVKRQNIEFFSLDNLSANFFIGPISGCIRSVMSVAHAVAAIYDKIINHRSSFSSDIKFAFDNFMRSIIEMIPIIGSIYANNILSKKMKSYEIDLEKKHSYIIKNKEANMFLFKNGKEIARCMYGKDIKIRQSFNADKKYIETSNLRK